ncbi:coatomer subunit alpha [Martiniozyma asiatica (nom. inval.)]|nr:coatomer subunit alpha [Martiniozyma asiatica]
MKMLTKFESKSKRAKGVAFHPKRPWILVSLHSSAIQLWDYRMGTLIHKFDEHEGPVRSVDFHPTQPIFVSGGDDYSIKVWSTQTKKCIFTLNGHLDYVRTVQFHHELPWIISCSDDQTIRIWNWQNRKEIACLTGHNHYVMCAQFHPKQNLVVSASLDQTVRVWDINGLVNKHSVATSTSSFDDGYSMRNQQLPPQQDIFGNTDAVVKYVLEGHDKGVNWASFHPELPLIVSGGDDRSVKLWRMSETRAWEVDGCRGHTSNVTCTLFHPSEPLIISVGEDKTIRTWDLNSRTPVKQFKRDHDRFWMISAHSQMNLFAAAHDTGVMVFKLDRERPAHDISNNEMFFVNNENQLQKFNFESKNVSLPMLSLKKAVLPWNKIRTISHNPSENSILVQSGDKENSIYSYYQLSKEIVGALEPNAKGEGIANGAYFIARNRFVTFVKSTKKLEIRDLNNNITKAINLDADVKNILPATPGLILLCISNVKYCCWSPDNQYVALLSKHTITLATKNLEGVMSMHETIRVKSAAWDETGVLIYSTLNHIKYVLLNGDKGTLKTLEGTLYITKVSGTHCYCLNRNGEVEDIIFDPTEYRFKKALINKNFKEVLRLIKSSNLVGENIISYLQLKGYPEIALQFVQDSETRFELAIECHNLEIALFEAQKIKNKSTWEKLGMESLAQGNIEIAELVYQQLNQLDKLSFLYLCTGDISKLTKMEQIAQSRNDLGSLYTNAIYLNDIEKKIETLMGAGLYPLAFATAKQNGLTELADTCLEQLSLTEDDVQLPEINELTLNIPQPINQSSISNWPLKSAEMSFFEQAITNGMEDLNIEDESIMSKNKINDNYNENKEDNLFNDEFDDTEDVEEDAWDLGDEDLEIELEENDEDGNQIEEIGDVGGLNDELKQWIKNSKCAAGFISTGKFDTAANMLNKQAGIVNFEPLRERFMQIYQSSKIEFPWMDEKCDNLTAFIRDPQVYEIIGKKVPLIPGFDQLDSLIQEGYKLFKSNKLVEAIELFRKTVYVIITLVVYSEEDELKCQEVLQLCKEYILALQIELERRKLDASDIKRNLELASYFASCELQPAHRLNALQVAMTQAFKAKNYLLASHFAGEFLKIHSSGPRSEQAKKIQLKSDSIATDAINVDFDPYLSKDEWEICAGDFRPLLKGEEIVREKVLGVCYGGKYKGSVCKVTLISEVGGMGAGVRIRN